MQKKWTQQSSQPGGRPKVVGRLYFRRICGHEKQRMTTVSHQMQQK